MITDRDHGDEDDGLFKRLDAGTATRRELVDFIQDGLAERLRSHRGRPFTETSAVMKEEMTAFLVALESGPGPGAVLGPLPEGTIVLTCEIGGEP